MPIRIIPTTSIRAILAYWLKCTCSCQSRVYLSLGNTRRHLKNLRRDPHVTLCVDVDPRLDHPSQAPRSVVCFGRAELLEDEARGRAILEKIEIRYVGGTPPELEEALWFEGRTAVVITPVRWLAWDQGKGRG